MISKPIGKEIVLVSDRDLHFLSSIKWHINYVPGSDIKYVAYRGSLLHRVIMGCKKGDGRIIDHRDRNGLNNCRENLRFCSHSENLTHCKKHKQSQYGFKGVLLEKHNGNFQWRSQIRVNGKRFRHWFKSKEEAAHDYDRMADLFYGEFSLTNRKLGLLKEEANP